MTTTIHDDKGTKRSITVSQDEGIRPNTTMEGLAKLKPAFKDGGSTTAGEYGQGTGVGLPPGTVTRLAPLLWSLGQTLGSPWWHLDDSREDSGWPRQASPP